MAIFHSSTKVFTRSKGHHAVMAAAYRSGGRLTCERTGLVFNFTRKREVEYLAILAPEGAPDWVYDRSKLANAIEAAESRVNSQLAREVEVALPHELNRGQQIQLLHGYVQEQFVSQGMVADIAIHAKKNNIHSHITLSLRELAEDGSGFGAKNRSWNDPKNVDKWRAAWSRKCNEALADAGHSERIDHRSHAERGIETPPTIHVGRKTPHNAEAYADRLAYNALVQATAELEKIKTSIREIDSQIIDLTTNIAQALAERDGNQSGIKPKSPASASSIWTPAGEQAIQPVTAASLLMSAQRKSSPRRYSALNAEDRTTPKENPNVQIIISPTQ
ncbi:mobilization protein A [mine drainage metagenome]|uniref:Mobilization protein A n=1 Tax=mine drainage metagenome TaxID=410659 RepID=A0A1J5PRU3_9ZZZZ